MRSAESIANLSPRRCMRPTHGRVKSCIIYDDSSWRFSAVRVQNTARRGGSRLRAKAIMCVVIGYLHIFTILSLSSRIIINVSVYRNRFEWWPRAVAAAVRPCDYVIRGFIVYTRVCNVLCTCVCVWRRRSRREYYDVTSIYYELWWL